MASRCKPRPSAEQLASRTDRRAPGAQRGQASLLLLGVVGALLAGLVVLFAFGQALGAKARHQRAADLAAVSAAAVMRDHYPRLFEPAELEPGVRNPRHLTNEDYLALALATAVRIARANGVVIEPSEVRFPDAGFAPTRVTVVARGRLLTGRRRPPPTPDRSAHGLRPSSTPRARPSSTRPRTPVAAATTARSPTGWASRCAPTSRLPSTAWPPQPAARPGWRSRSTAAFAPTPSRRGCGPQTRIEVGRPAGHEPPPLRHRARPRTAGRLRLAGQCEAFGFIHRYAWEDWHYGLGPNPAIAITRLNTRRGSWAARGDHGRVHHCLPSFVPPRFHDPIARAALRWNVPMNLLAAQLYAESGFNPFARSPAGAEGIAQFMPGTAVAYGLANPYDPVAAIDAQAHLMRDLLRRFGGRVAWALAGYNAGVGAVERYGGVPPCPETRAYVAEILGLLGGAGDLGAAVELRWRWSSDVDARFRRARPDPRGRSAGASRLAGRVPFEVARPRVSSRAGQLSRKLRAFA